MLDTNTLIYLIKHRPPAVAPRVSSLPENETLCMSFFTFVELLKGAAGSAQRDEALRRLDLLTRQIPVVYSTGAILCQHYAAQFMRLKAAGTPIGANDHWVACHALSEDASLVTNHLREFERVTGLRVDNWVA